MDQTLWNELRANPENQKSSLQLNAERNAQEHARALQNAKKPITKAERESAAQRFRAIEAQNELEAHLDATSLIETRKAEVQEQILAGLKDVSTPAESAEICRRAVPLLQHFVVASSDYQVTEWVGHQIEAIRAEKAAKQLAGLE